MFLWVAKDGSYSEKNGRYCAFKLVDKWPEGEPRLPTYPYEHHEGFDGTGKEVDVYEWEE